MLRRQRNTKAAGTEPRPNDMIAAILHEDDYCQI